MYLKETQPHKNVENHKNVEAKLLKNCIPVDVMLVRHGSTVNNTIYITNQYQKVKTTLQLDNLDLMCVVFAITYGKPRFHCT